MSCQSLASYAFEPHAVYSFAIYILFIDVDLDEFRVGVWKDPDCLQIQDPSLLRLASSLPKEGGRSFHESRGISYTTAKDIMKKKLGIFFDDLRKLRTHSLRSGGASDPGCSHLSDLSLHRPMADGNVFNRKTSTLSL